MSYMVVRHSQVWGTQAFPADTAESAIALLGRLAQEADTDRQKDGIQRYFCIAQMVAMVEPVTLPSYTLVTYLQDGRLQWVGADNPCLCLLVLESDASAEPAQATCREMPLNPLSTLEEGLRQMVADYLVRLRQQDELLTAEMTAADQEEEAPCLAS